MHRRHFAPLYYAFHTLARILNLPFLKNRALGFATIHEQPLPLIVFLILQMPDCWLEVSTWNVLRPAISTHVFLGFPVSTSKC
jgi:hypothetical protein